MIDNHWLAFAKDSDQTPQSDHLSLEISYHGHSIFYDHPSRYVQSNHHKTACIRHNMYVFGWALELLPCLTYQPIFLD